MTRIERLTLGILWVVSGLVLLVMYLPAVVVVLMSFFPVQRQTIDWRGFTLVNFEQAFKNTEMISALGNSLTVAFISIIAASTFALAAGYYMVSGERKGRAFLESMIYLPFILPAIITGISLLIMFQEFGVERSLFTVTIGHAIIVLAIIYRMVMVRLNTIPQSQIEASRDLGGTEWQTFRKVIAPQLVPALVTSALLAFTISFDETLVTFFLVGGDATLPIRLLGKMRVGFSPDVNALVTCVLLLTIFLAGIGTVTLRTAEGKGT
ncbi:ABC transporter permease [Mesorhizobium argentiipisi]|uniref:ABC transporter permease n=1 Tax=Mesorhizobium argentiipisi TaxID=3015175 RepID=A0ABU8K9Z2_9HYPH